MTGTDGSLHYNQWPESEERQLEIYWELGYSAGVIGDMMKKTRNAIIGKVHRLGLAARAPRRNPLVEKPRKDPGSYGQKKSKFNPSYGRPKGETTRVPTAHRAPVPLTEIVPLNGEGITILDLHKDHCHAVIQTHGYKTMARYCGLRTVEGESYCADHYVAFHMPSYPRVR